MREMGAMSEQNSNGGQKGVSVLHFFGKPLWSWLFPYALLIFIPVSIILNYLKVNPAAVFISTILAVIPVVALMARSTEDLSRHSGTLVASLLNVTFGNAFEIIIGIFAIRAGLIEMVKASLVGSIVFNLLMVVGFSMFAGGLKYKEQRFNRSSVGVSSSMLLIAVAGLAMPTLYSALTGKSTQVMSEVVAATLGVTYVLSLVFALFTHRHLFRTQRSADEQAGWSRRKALIVLFVTVILAAMESEILVGNVHSIIDSTGISQIFVGLVVIGIVGNIPEIMTAVSFGLKDKITQSLEIGMNSATQIALFAIPILVFASPLLGVNLSLAFAPFQLVAMVLAVMIINYLGSDGVCNWLEGVQLLAVYVIIAIAFYFI
jgi:Ca2+:H+ antiporter